MTPRIVSVAKFVLGFFPAGVREYARANYREWAIERHRRQAEAAAEAAERAEAAAREAQVRAEEEAARAAEATATRAAEAERQAAAERARAAEQEAERITNVLRSAGVDDIPRPDVLSLLHHLRGEALKKLPQGVDRFVSVGCAGLWYFEWIARCCAPKHHVGIEFYAPRPEGLPAGTEWIANTAGNMQAVADSSADVLFSGQNIEHLWPEDLANFLLESHRVLKPGGLLVVDSPHRRITARLDWVMGEHTVELDWNEACELFELAGFDVERKFGIWLCEAPGTHELLPWDQITTDGAWPIQRRIAEAHDHLDESFFWWIEARRSGRAPQAAPLRRRVAEIFAIAWPERLARLKTTVGKVVKRDGVTWFDSEGRSGALVYGPPAPLRAGRYRVTFDLEWVDGAASDSTHAVAHVLGGPRSEILVTKELAPPAEPGPMRLALDFELPETMFEMQFVFMSPAGARVLARRGVDLVPLAA